MIFADIIWTKTVSRGNVYYILLDSTVNQFRLDFVCKLFSGDQQHASLITDPTNVVELLFSHLNNKKNNNIRKKR